MNSYKNQKAHNLYANKPLFKALMIIIIPSLLMALMTGIYYFMNQVMIIRFVPSSHGNAQENFTYWFGKDIGSKYGYIEGKLGADFLDVGAIVKGAISISSPIATIIGTSPFFIAGGAVVLFTQSLGNNNQTKAQEVFKTTFWMLVILACFETTLLLCINHPLLNALSAPIKHTGDEVLNDYYQKVHDLQIKIASQITIGYSAGLIIPMFMIYFASLIKAEGRFKLVAIVTICTNLLNIGLTTLLVIVAKMDAYSAPISTITSQGLNLIILISFLIYINKKNRTWLMFCVLFKKGLCKFKLNLINPVILVGLSSFLIDISFAIANMFFIPILANVASNASIFPQANGDGMYFQTIEGAVMPILNLIFIAIYGIIDGGRLIIAYNYSLGNWKRIKKTYYYLTLISLCTATIMLSILTFGFGEMLLSNLFQISDEMLHNAYMVLILENGMILIFCFQASVMAIFMAMGDIVRSNISAIFQDIITFFPVLGICVGLTYATNDIWILVACYVINAFVATALMTAYTIWWLKKRLGHVVFKVKCDNKLIKMWYPINLPGPSFVNVALQTI